MDDVKKVTILHTIETAGPGGAETMLLNLASGLDTRRFRSLALLPEGRWLPARLRERGVPTFVLESRSGGTFEPMRTMARLVREQKVDLIHSHLPDQNFYSCLVGRFTGRKTVVTYHGAVRPREIQGVKGAVKAWAIRHWATAVVVVSEYLREGIRALGVPAERVVRIYNGKPFQRPDSGAVARGVAVRERNPAGRHGRELARKQGLRVFCRGGPQGTGICS